MVSSDSNLAFNFILLYLIFYFTICFSQEDLEVFHRLNQARQEIENYDEGSGNRCDPNPCVNSGSCFDVKFQNDFACLCPPRWTGKRCESPNLCIHNPCQHGGNCEMVDVENVSCSCPKGYVGKFCERFCPSYLCDNNSTCVLDEKTRQFKCVCALGFVGEHCDKEIDECYSNPCLNGASCVNKAGKFKCVCLDGYTGAKCQRLCKDVYKSCKLWHTENRCEWARQFTGFFDINCAKSCQRCKPADNITNDTNLCDEIPFPPILESFSFLMGAWETKTTDIRRFPTDFTTATEGYKETVKYMATEVPMFGTPSVNYSLSGVNLNDPNDIHTSVGFLTLKPGTSPLKTFLMTTNNEGVATIEEGTLINDTMLFTLIYVHSMSDTVQGLPRSSQRTLKVKNAQLHETVLKYDFSGNFYYYTKIYRRIS